MTLKSRYAFLDSRPACGLGFSASCQTGPRQGRIPYLGYRYHHFGVTQDFQEGVSAPSHPPLRAETASFTARAENNQKPREIFRPVAQKTRGKALFPSDRTHAADWTSAGKTGIASPTGHRRSKKHRKEVARRKDSRSAAPIRTQIGTSVPLAQAARKSGLCFRIQLVGCSGWQAAAPRGPSRTCEGDGARVDGLRSHPFRRFRLRLQLRALVIPAVAVRPLPTASVSPKRAVA